MKITFSEMPRFCAECADDGECIEISFSYDFGSKVYANFTCLHGYRFKAVLSPPGDNLAFTYARVVTTKEIE